MSFLFHYLIVCFRLPYQPSHVPIHYSKCSNFNSFLQYDAFEIGFITTDDFTNADILEATYPAVAKRLHGDWINDPAIPVVTGFLGKVAPFTYSSTYSFFSRLY